MRRLHAVRCPRCLRKFDLASVSWCKCDRRERSKVCTHCEQCACGIPEYDDPAFWIEPPAPLRDLGFERLFVYYL